MKETIRYIIGYLLGIAIVLFLIPYWQYSISIKEYSLPNDIIFKSYILRISTSVILLIIGIIFGAWSNIYLYEHGKGVPFDAFNKAISPRSKNLLTTGPYRFCRNPMLFGTICAYSAFGLLLNSFRSFMVAAGFTIFMIIYVKLFEEKRLRNDFGDEFIQYKKSVPMIFPYKVILEIFKKKEKVLQLKR